MPQTIDMTGQRFGRLLVLGQATPRNTAQRSKWWLCRCDCGREVAFNGANVRQGISRSCGCLRHELLVTRNTKHGLSKTREYEAWSGAKGRCFNTAAVEYKYYGARGITMCQAWRDSFETFLRDMGPCPTQRGKRSTYSLDRINNDGNYEPSNCRWTSQGVQVRNSRKARRIAFNGETLCLKDWARRLGIHDSSLRERLKKWPIERALAPQQ